LQNQAKKSKHLFSFLRDLFKKNHKYFIQKGLELREIEQVKKEWIKKIVACRGKLLSLPSKVAPHFPLCDTSLEMKEVLNYGIVEAL
jgi:hypothetical protein